MEGRKTAIRCDRAQRVLGPRKRGREGGREGGRRERVGERKIKRNSKKVRGGRRREGGKEGGREGGKEHLSDVERGHAKGSGVAVELLHVMEQDKALRVVKILALRGEAVREEGDHAPVVVGDDLEKEGGREGGRK